MFLNSESLRELRQRNPEKIIGLGFGTFDIIHPDHIKYLEYAKKQCDILVIAVTHDKQVAKSKGPGRPIMGQLSRALTVSAMKPVTYVSLRTDGDPYASAKATYDALMPDLLIFGSDWGYAVMDEWKADYPDLKIVVAPESLEFSTTKLIAKIKHTSQLN